MIKIDLGLHHFYPINYFILSAVISFLKSTIIDPIGNALKLRARSMTFGYINQRRQSGVS